MRLKLLYIASNGRSGSSVLDRYLGQLKGVVTLGELQMLYHEVYSRERRCGCGLLMKECSHWKIVSDKVQDLKLTSTFRERPGRGKVLRFEKLLSLFRSKSDKWDTEYALATLRIIQKAYSEYFSSSPIFVDASKDPYRLNSLLASDVFALTVVHLVKDPRGFVFSMTKVKTGLKRKILIIRFALRYLIENWMISRVTRKIEPRRVLLLRYEDFALNQGSIDDFVKHNYARPDDEMNSNTDLPQHPVAGNFARFGDRQLKLDERWKCALTVSEKKMIWIICGLLAKRFGYQVC